jgi:hypothetical protein
LSSGTIRDTCFTAALVEIGRGERSMAGALWPALDAPTPGRNGRNASIGPKT